MTDEKRSVSTLAARINQANQVSREDARLEAYRAEMMRVGIVQAYQEVSANRA